MYFLTNLREDINKFFRLNYFWLVPLLSFVVFQIFFYSANKINYLDLDKLDHNTLLTINVTLAGFLLTGLTIMISVRDKPFIQTLIRASYWQKIELSVYLGITFHIISSLLCLVTLLINKQSILIFNLEITFFIVGITYLLVVVYWLKQAFTYI